MIFLLLYLMQINIGEFSKVVCREGFASLHGIGVKSARRLGLLKTEAKSPFDNRGPQ